MDVSASRPVRRWPAALLLAALLALACWLRPAAAPAQGQAPLAQPEAALLVEGRLVPRQDLSLAAAIPGRAARVLVREGQVVAAGDVLVELDSYPQFEAQVSAAELEVALARQALKDLQQKAAVELAETQVELEQARKDLALHEDLYASLVRPPSQQQIEQARSNLMMAEKRLERAREDLAKTQKYYNNKNHFLWMFMNARQFKLRITQQEGHIAELERLVSDRKEKLDDLLSPPDEIDVAMAAAQVEVLNARVADLERRVEELSTGPDSDELELAQKRLEKAEAGLAAAQVALRQAQIIAPAAGRVVSVNVKAGEWMPAGEPRIVLADLEHWEVRSDEVPERDVVLLQPGQAVQLRFPALGVTLPGRIERLDLGYQEVDGDVYYGMEVDLEEVDPRLRWGMTAEIEVVP